jgi:signal transduction histidine kinase
MGQLVAPENPMNDDDLRQQIHSSVNAAALQIGRLADELYAMSVLEGEPPPLNRQPIDLVSLAQRMVELYQQTTGTHQIRVVAASPALIGAFDETLLERVLSNLLTNIVSRLR